MNLLIVSGLSGSGKSIALHTLEDLDYYCIDNLPIGLLEAFATQLADFAGKPGYEHAAVGIDARNQAHDLQHFPDILKHLAARGIKPEILFLQADEDTLLKRFSETRRKHPLSGGKTTLADAIMKERELLDPIAARADIFIDTSHTNVHQLRDLVHSRVAGISGSRLSLLFQSFGFKHGIPSDADFVFDVRCLPNPHWEPHLRPLTGLDPAVADYLERQPSTRQMIDSLTGFLETWLPSFQADNRSYMTIAIGCTGGQHRSVYMVSQLEAYFSTRYDGVLARHRELS